MSSKTNRNHSLRPFRNNVNSQGKSNAFVWNENNSTKCETDHHLFHGDCATVIQKGINKLHADGGGNLWVYPGDYSLSDDICVYPHISICGGGWDKTTFIAEHPCGWVTHSSVKHLDKFTISDLTFDGDNQGGESTKMLFDGNPTRSIAMNIRVMKCGPRGQAQTSRGLEFRGGAENCIRHCYAYNCAGTSISLQYCDDGIIENCEVVEPNVSAPYTHAITINGATQTIVRQCSIDGRGTIARGVSCVDSNDSVVTDNIIKGVTTPFDITNADVTMSNNRLINIQDKDELIGEWMNEGDEDADGSRERICPNCGDDFNTRDEMVVEDDNGQLYCSIDCLNGVS